MTKKSNEPKVSAADNSSEPQTAHQDVAPGGAELTPVQQLSEIRSLLFGEQLAQVHRQSGQLSQQVDERFHLQQDRFKTELATLRADINQRLDKLAQELQDLDQRHQAQEKSLVSELIALGNQLQAAHKGLEADDQQIREQLSNQSNYLMAELTTKHEEVMARLVATSDELKNNMADRKTLATLLASMAHNLEDEQ